MSAKAHSVTHSEAFTCKKCSNPLQEGQAYELGDDRWHLDCFVCGKCANPLGCESNFLVLGNGGLVCSDCSYNCKQCDKKIDDLAILTGDQAYCSDCFRCRLCRNRIEDLRYARTSKGLFCMDCHKKLVDRKKSAKLGSSVDPKRSLRTPDVVPSPHLSPLDPNTETFIASSSGRTANGSSKLYQDSARRQTEIKLLPNPPDELPMVIVTTPDSGPKDTRVSSFDPKLKNSLRSGNDGKPSSLSIPDSTSTASMGSMPDSESELRLTFDPKSSNPLRSTSGPNSISPVRSDVDLPSKNSLVSSSNLDPTTPLISSSNSKSKTISGPSTANDRSNERIDALKSNNTADENWDIYVSHSSIEEIGIFTDDDDYVPQSTLQSSRLPVKPKTSTVNGYFDLCQPLKDPKVTSKQPTEGNSPESSAGIMASPLEESAPTTSEGLRAHSPYLTLRKSDSSPKGTPRLELNSESGKNILILSPSQYMENGMYSNSSSPSNFARSPHNSSFEEIKTHADDVTPTLLPQFSPKRRKSLQSPLAKANRQVRVVETFDYDKAESKELMIIHASPEVNIEGVVSPLARTPLVSQTSSSFKSALSNDQSSLTSTTKKFPGLGVGFCELPDCVDPLDPNASGVDRAALRGTHSAPLRTPSMSSHFSRLAFGFGNKSGSSPASVDPHDLPRDLLGGRVSGTRSGRFSHGRSASGGSIISSMFGLLHAKKDADGVVTDARSNHARHKSDASTHSYTIVHPHTPTFASSPLTPRSPAMGHLRSASDTPFITSLDARFFDERGLAKWKEEMEKLHDRKRILEAEVMQLESSKRTLAEEHQMLQEQVAQMRLNLEQENLRYEKVVLECDQLKKKRDQQIMDNNNLASTFPIVKEHHGFFGSNATDLLTSSAFSRLSRSSSSLSIHLTNASSSTDTLAEDVTRDSLRQPRLKFWRRGQKAGNGFSNHQRAASSAGRSVSTSQIYNSSNGGTHLAPSREVSSLKSRSTMILDSISASFSSNTISECGDVDNVPLLASSIEARAKYERAIVPFIITRCIEEVEKRGLEMQGIYRLSGSSLTTAAILNAFANLPPQGAIDERSRVKLDELIGGDINAVTSALKRYLIHLPEPLITFDVYDAFIAVGALGDTVSRADRIEDLRRNVLSKMPRANLHATYMLFKHLKAVEQHSSTNKMNYKNLSLMFGPTIARERTGGREMLDMGHKADATELMLSNYDAVFNEH